MVICRETERSAHSAIYQVLDEVRAAGARGLPPGLRGILFSAVDRLRDEGAPAEETELAGRIVVAVHRLEVSMLAGDRADEQSARSALLSLAGEWLNVRICVH